MTTDHRSRFHRELEELEDRLMGVAKQAERMVGDAIEAIRTRDRDLSDQVIQADLMIDQTYIEIQNRWLELMARQQPMGSDLRLMSTILGLNTTLERMGDQCVNIAKLTNISQELPQSEIIIEEITEMGNLVKPMIRTAVEAFVHRDVELARQLSVMDEPVDRLNRGMYRRVVECGPQQELLEWATRMMMVSRALERIGDQAVDMAEQVYFLVTGELLEGSGWDTNPLGTALPGS